MTSSDIPGARRPRRAISFSVLCGLVGALGFLPDAHAEFKLHYPVIDYREFEFEQNGTTTFDKRNTGRSNNQSYTFEVGYAPVWYWEPEIESESGLAE